MNDLNEAITLIKVAIDDLDFCVPNGAKEYKKASIDVLVNEIERLKKGYCKIKEKCNKGECDCTMEEYNEMCETNLKLDLELEREKSKVKEYGERMLKAIEYIHWRIDNGEDMYITQMIELLDILKGENKK